MVSGEPWLLDRTAQERVPVCAVSGSRRYDGVNGVQPSANIAADRLDNVRPPFASDGRRQSNQRSGVRELERQYVAATVGSHQVSVAITESLPHLCLVAGCLCDGKYRGRVETSR